MGRKHSGKRRNCWLRAISPFPSVFETKYLDTSIFSNMKEPNFIDKIENIVGKGEENMGKGEIVGYQHLLLFP